MVTQLLKFVHPKKLLTMKNKTQNKKFDAVKMMRDLREKINKEIAGMTTDQIIDYFKKAREQYEKEIAVR